MKSEIEKIDKALFYKMTLMLFLLLNAFLLFPMLNEGFLYGDDNTSNFVYTVRIAEMIREGNFRFWLPDYSMGQALFLYYQPLPHLLTACIYLLFPFLEPLMIYKALVLLAVVLLPMTMYIGMRWMNFTRTMSLIGAIVVCSVSSWRGFGFEINTLFEWGQYSHLWGLVLTPLVIGYNYKNFYGKRKLFFAATSLGLLFLTHAVMGIIACASVGSLFLISSWNPKDKIKDLVFFLQLFCAVFAIASIIIVPNMLFEDFVDGFSTVDREKHHGIGLQKALLHFSKGDFFDKKQWPVITAGVSIGLLVLCFLLTRFKSLLKSERQQILFFLVNAILALVLISGTQSFPFLKHTPVINSVLFLRLLPYFHFIGILLFAFGLGTIISYAGSKYSYVSAGIQFTKFLGYSICAVGLLLVAHRHTNMIDSKARVFNHVGPGADKIPGFAEVMDTLEQYPHARMHMEKIGTHFELHLPPLLADKPIAKFVAASSHTNLGLYYLRNIDSKDPYQLDLFNIHYLLSKIKKPVPDFATPILRNKRYNLSATNSKPGYFDVVHSNTVVLSHNQAARKLVSHWMNTPELLKKKEHIVIAGDQDQAFFEEIGFTKFINLNGDNKRVPANFCTIENKENQEEMDTKIDGPLGNYLLQNTTHDVGNITSKILEEHHEDGYYRAKIDVKNTSEDGLSWAMVKVNAHPDWMAKVNGRVVEWVQMSPCFMAVPIKAGVHTVEFEFGISPLRKLLLIIAFLTISGLGFMEFGQSHRSVFRNNVIYPFLPDKKKALS